MVEAAPVGAAPSAAAAEAGEEAEGADDEPEADAHTDAGADEAVGANASMELPGDSESGPKPVLLGRGGADGPESKLHGRKRRGVLSRRGHKDLRHESTGQTLSHRAVVALHCNFVLSGLLSGFFVVLAEAQACRGASRLAGGPGRPGSHRRCRMATGLYQFPALFRLLYALFLDRVGFFGSRRRSWIIFGWTVALLLIVALAFLASSLSEDGGLQAYALVVMTVYAFHMISDVAGNGMIIEVTRLEGDEIRGLVLATSQLVHGLAASASGAIATLAMNDAAHYSETEGETIFSHGLGLGQAHGVLAAASLPFFVTMVRWLRDVPREDAMQPDSYVAAFHSLWLSAKTKASLCVVALSLVYTVVAALPSPAVEALAGLASPNVLQRKVGRVVGALFFVAGVWLCRAVFLSIRWRWALACCLLPKLLEGGLALLLLYGGPYWGPRGWLDALAGAVPRAASGLAHILTLLVVAEIAPQGSEATAFELILAVRQGAARMSAGLQAALWAALALDGAGAGGAALEKMGGRLAGATYLALAIQAFGLLASLAMLPAGRSACKEWLLDARWHRQAVGVLTVSVAAVAVGFSVAVSLLGMAPETSCLRIAGGNGC